jgi:hypothetical protein
MSTYKVIQDIEAEDHILGPLSLRQFIYGLVAALCFYLCYFFISRHLAFLIALVLPPGLFCAFFAFPFGKDQPTEVWAVAKVRFLFKPRRRIWDQDGAKQLVTVTAPKKIEGQRTNNLSENEVRSRLSALATTIDSRGWAIKNVNVNLYTQQTAPIAPAGSDRLVDASSIPQNVPDFDVQASDDIMDAQNNPIAQQFDQMIASSEQTHRQKLETMLSSPAEQTPAATSTPVAPAASPQDNPAPAPNYWFLNEPAEKPKLEKDQAMFAPQVVMPGTDDAGEMMPAAMQHAIDPTNAEEALVKQLRESHKPPAAFGHMKTILPLSQQPPTPPPPPPAPPQPNPATILATDNDKNIDVLAREAKRMNSKPGNDDGEVVISLH